MIGLIVSVILFTIMLIPVVVNMRKINNLRDDFEKEKKANILTVKTLEEKVNLIEGYLNNVKTISNHNENKLGAAVAKNKVDITKLKKK